MRYRRLLAAPIALLVPAAVMLLAATGVVAPGTWSPPVGAAPVVSGQTPVSGHGRCVLDIPHGPLPVDAGGSAYERSAPTVPGDISVAIPPTVFIRIEGRSMVVTTNTGMAPTPQDGFWILNGSRATPADASTRAEVLADCTPLTRR